MVSETTDHFLTVYYHYKVLAGKHFYYASVAEERDFLKNEYIMLLFNYVFISPGKYCYYTYLPYTGRLTARVCSL